MSERGRKRERDEEDEKDKRYATRVDGSGEERGHGKVSCSAPVKLLLAIVRPSPTSVDALRPSVRPIVPKYGGTRGKPVMGPRWVYIYLMPAAIRNKLLGGLGN